MSKKKKKTDDQPNFDGLGLDIDKMNEPTIEGKKVSGGKTGPPLLNPKNWIPTLIKLDPELKQKAKKITNNDENRTFSHLINDALRAYLKGK